MQVQVPDFSEGLDALRALEKDFGVMDAVITSLEVNLTWLALAWLHFLYLNIQQTSAGERSTWNVKEGRVAMAC